MKIRANRCRVCVGGVVRTVYSSEVSRTDATCTSAAFRESRG